MYHYLVLHFDKFGFNPKKYEKKWYQQYVLQKWYPLRINLYHQHMQNKGNNEQRLSGPAISDFVLIRKNKISNDKINKNADIGSIWRARLTSRTYFVVLSPPLTQDS